MARRGNKGESQRSPKGFAFETLEQLLTIMSKHDVAELEWEKNSERLYLRKQGDCCGNEKDHPVVLKKSETALAEETEKKAPINVNNNQKQVLSPLVGTFYRSPAPDAKEYVREGESIQRGQVLCLIEAMKLMNEIESEYAGKVVSILVENGQPVEYGEPLFLIETL